MHFAFCLFRYFPFGGLERNFRRIADECVLRGHHISVYTREWRGELPENLAVEILPIRGIKAWSNHARDQHFAQCLHAELQDHTYDAVVGFNKMPGLDVYYGADPCYQSITQHKPWYYKLTPRYRHYSAFELAVFGQLSQSTLMLLSQPQSAAIQDCYQVDTQRIHLLPPGISRDRQAPENAQLIRQAWRTEFSIQPDEKVILALGADFKRKGLKRTLYAIAALPEQLRLKTHLVAIGDSRISHYQQLAKQLGIAKQVQFLQGRNDIPRFLQGADLFAHPAHIENTGNVILEAIIAGLPVIATAVCGYAQHIDWANAGIIIPEPFEQHHYKLQLETMLTSDQQHDWNNNGIHYGLSEDLYSRPQVAADIIEQVAKAKRTEH